ncbi:hypothetical protein GJ629_09705 [Halapricum sp. CBA1109]|uniref:antitoxin VapB family protein n=1 Tax=Halapricum sp. CBA1109 TaxID=2668068 RepID=UPI0012FB806B|nr:antitoxin VapB family protein [Halapricum sp. CBA1109]MUV90130.1 hypothetical protein [Halapricum sp. CBA1109]
MGTKTIGIREEVYERLDARKRDDESFTEFVDRLLDETTPDWREGFGTLDGDEAAALREAVEQSRERTGEGLADRQRRAIEELAERNTDDETA